MGASNANPFTAITGIEDTKIESEIAIFASNFVIFDLINVFLSENPALFSSLCSAANLSVSILVSKQQ